MEYVIIYADEITSRKEFYDAIEHHICVPEYFGRNLDSLHDILSERRMTLEIRGFELLQERLGKYADLIRKMLENTALECENFNAVIK